MKKQLLLLFSLVSILSLYSQNQKSSNFLFSKNDLITKFHTLDDLENYGKAKLVNLYIQRNSELQKILPFIALTTKPNKTLLDVGVKVDLENQKKLSKHNATFNKYKAENRDLISEFVAYADSDNLMWSILYLEEVIKKIRIGFNGNF